MRGRAPVADAPRDGRLASRLVALAAVAAIVPSLVAAGRAVAQG